MNGPVLDPDRRFDPYDPRTLNPYVPLQDPGLWLLGPMVVFLAAAKGRKKKGKTRWWLLLLLVVGLGASVALTACGPGVTPTPEPEPTETPVPPPTPPPSYTPPPTTTPTTPPTSTPHPTPTIPPITCTPTPPEPTPTPTPGPDDRLDVEERIRVIEEAANLYHGDVPVGLVLAIAAQETGEQYDPPWNNEETNGDGIMQVTEDSGFDKHKPYKNTRSSIEENMLDATDYLKDILATVRRYPGYGDYGDIFQEIPQWDLVRTPLHYNGGPDPIEVYSAGGGDPRYLGRVAGHLDTGGTVGRVFGHEYTDPVLAEALRAGQSELKTNFPRLFKDN